MDMLDGLGGQEAGDDMARAVSKPLDGELIEQFVARIKAALGDADTSKAVIAELSEHPSLSAQEVVEIAYRLLGGIKPRSRKAALTAIGQERLRVSHAKSKRETAAKVRLW